jgi:hypothetical protein
MKDRYNMQDTPESAEERDIDRQARYERDIEIGDWLRDELRDREMEKQCEQLHGGETSAA